MTLSQIKNLLEKNNLRPNKVMGQNFLIDENIQKKIIAAGNPTPAKTILEVGPGLGALSFALAERAGRLIAIEKDPALATILKKDIDARKLKNVNLIVGDILKQDNDFFHNITPYHVIANIPYYLTARLIRQFLDSESPPESMFLTIQKEVAERITATPPHMNLLALAVQSVGRPKTLFSIPKESFWPTPDVDSALISIDHISNSQFIKNKIDKAYFFSILRKAFQGKRKVLSNTLASLTNRNKKSFHELLLGVGIKETARPEELSLSQWMTIVSQVARRNQPC